MLDAFAHLLCSKLCRHNWRKPSRHVYVLGILPASHEIEANLHLITFSLTITYFALLKIHWLHRILAHVTLLIGVILSELHHVRSIVKFVFLLACMYVCMLVTALYG